MFFKQLPPYGKLLSSCLTTALLSISDHAWTAPTGQFEVIHNFPYVGGFYPNAPTSLIRGKDGNLYGTTSAQTLSQSGTIFKLDLRHNPAAYSEYYGFAGFGNSTESFPLLIPRHLFQARNRNFYVSGLGQGIFAGPEYLFQVTHSTPPQASFAASYPTWMSDATFSNRLVEGKNGKLYTTITHGGGYIGPFYGRSAGAILEIDPTNTNPSNRMKILHIFDGINGFAPTSGLTRIKNSFYGTTCGNTKNTNGTVTFENNGVIFRYDLKPTGNTYTVLHRFNGAQGACPQGELLRARNSKFYGSTWQGGKANKGVIFELDVNRAIPSFRVVHTFNGVNGANPYKALVESPQGGNLVGVTYNGGNLDRGTVFQLDIKRQLPRFSILHAFDAQSSGKNPGDIVYGSDCKLYGIANGDSSSGGLLYRFKANFRHHEHGCHLYDH